MMSKFGKKKKQKNRTNTVYICSPYRPVSETEDERKAELRTNIRKAVDCCRIVSSMGYVPLAAHLYFPRFLDDNNPADRKKGLALGLRWLEQSDEVWVFGKSISEGMEREIVRANQLGIPVCYMDDPDVIYDRLMSAIFEHMDVKKKGGTKYTSSAHKNESEDKNNG